MLCNFPKSSALFFSFARLLLSKAPCRSLGRQSLEPGIFLEFASRGARPERNNPSLLESDLIAPEGVGRSLDLFICDPCLVHGQDGAELRGSHGQDRSPGELGLQS